MRLYAVLLASTLLASPLGCSKPAPAPAPAPVPAEPAPTTPAPAEPAPAEPAAAEPAAAEPAPAAAPTTFTPVDSPTLADIPAAPVRCKVLGKDYDAPTVKLTYSSSDWTLEVAFAEKELFSIPLSDQLAAPGAGYTKVTPKACCPGYLHRAEPGGSPVSLNAPNGVAIEITTWDVADWKEDGGMQQPAGKVTGRLAVAYDADNWVAGSFSIDFEYFGEPPLVRQAREQREREAAAAAVGAWKDLPAPAGVTVSVGDKVWAASVRGASWQFGQSEVTAVAGTLITLAGDRFTAVGLVRPLTPQAELEAGAFVAAVDHLGPQFARVVTVGDEIEVSYLNPASKPRTNTIAASRIFAYAASADAAGMPPIVFFDYEGYRAAGEAVAVDGADTVVVLDGGKGLVRVPTASTVVAGATKALKKGAKVEAIVGCGMNGWSPREGKIVEVVEGGIGYKVDAEPCKGTTVSGARLRLR